MPLQQLLERRFDHGTSQMLNRGSKHDSQLSVAMLKSNLLDLLRVDESLEVDDLWIPVIGVLLGEQEGRGAIGANRVPDNCFQGVINEVAGRANLDGQHQRVAAWICANEINRSLHCRKGTRTSKADDRRSLQVVTEAHVRDEATAYIRTHISGACADCKEIDILNGSSG